MPRLNSPAAATNAVGDARDGRPLEPPAATGSSNGPTGSPDRARRVRPLKSSSRASAPPGPANNADFAPLTDGPGEQVHEPDTAPVPLLPPAWDELVVDAGAPMEGVVIKTGQAAEGEGQGDGGDGEWRYPAPTSKAKAGAAGEAGAADTNGRRSRLRLRRRTSPPR